jgi:hypothetical protein
MKDFERGHPRMGGPKPGGGKASLLAMLRERYPDFHPVLAMLDLANKVTTPVEVKARLLNDVASYTVPRIKPIEFTELQRWLSEHIATLPDGNPIERFIEAFLNGQLSANDLTTLTAALSLKRQAETQAIDNQAEILKLIK